MELKNILSDKKAPILKKWIDMTMEYFKAGPACRQEPPDNRFADPVGYAVSRGLKGIFEGLVSSADSAAVKEGLVAIVEIAAVQEAPPSRTLSFVLVLKQIVREELGAGIAGRMSRELSLLEAEIDQAALSAFDIFMERRARIFEIRANEQKRANFRLLQKAKLIGAANVPSASPEGNNFIIKEGR